ncbi:PH domain-containing protein [Actinophytocola sp.]|uniref:PH domain-containing protein n=1 Tax=Actinophytocola sp. TaxID=1872138 RepID=UPI002D7E6CE1|nr:PH domain-containing protein [Actinophytocola sp.]HET9139272.1 PH domain-containing protein [Actinophytocola sp.]
MSAQVETVRLRPPANRVERRAVWWWMTQEALGAVIPALILAVLAFVIEPARFWLVFALVAVLVVGIPYAVVVPFWRFRVHRWEVTGDAVYAKSGWLWQEWRVAPMSRIQTVDTERGPLERSFRLSSLTVTTASAAGPIKIVGLDHERAADLAQRLTETTQATRGDAT